MEHREEEVEEEMEDGAVVVVEAARGGLLVYELLEYTGAVAECEAVTVTGGVVEAVEGGDDDEEEDTVLLLLQIVADILVLTSEPYCDDEGSVLYRGHGVMMIDLSSFSADAKLPPLITSFSI